MNKKILTIIVLILIISLIGISRYVANKEVVEYTRDDAVQDEVQRPKETIDIKYQYRDGEHIFVGTLEVPTPCHLINTEVVEIDGLKEIKINVVDSGEICTQVVTSKNFKVSFVGERDDSYIASLNGEIVNLNIFEIPYDEDINDIEIYNKG